MGMGIDNLRIINHVQPVFLIVSQIDDACNRVSTRWTSLARPVCKDVMHA